MTKLSDYTSQTLPRGWCTRKLRTARKCRQESWAKPLG